MFSLIALFVEHRHKVTLSAPLAAEVPAQPAVAEPQDGMRLAA